MLLRDKVALVTGGGRGIGRAHAKELAAAGATVIVNDLGGSAAGQGTDTQPAESAVAEIEAAGGQAVADYRDISSWDQAHQLVNAAAAHWQETGAAPGRAIVNTASPQGAHPTWPIGIYSVSKAAVLALTQTAAMELAPLGGRVNALAPIARTRMVGEAADTDAVMPRDADFDRYLPDHVARVVLYLVSLPGFPPVPFHREAVRGKG